YFADLDRLSGGALHIHDVTESWKSDAGPVSVTLTACGVKQTLHPQYLDDYLDTNVACNLNKLLPKSGKHFEIGEPDDQSGFVMFVDDDVRGALSSDHLLGRLDCVESEGNRSADKGRDFEKDVLDQMKDES